MLLTRVASAKGNNTSLITMIDSRLKQGKLEHGFTMQ